MKKFVCILSSEMWPNIPYLIVVAGAESETQLDEELARQAKEFGVSDTSLSWKKSELKDETGTLYAYQNHGAGLDNDPSFY
jgi:hypothetical protein